MNADYPKQQREVDLNTQAKREPSLV
jgi:hypothetical protein